MNKRKPTDEELYPMHACARVLGATLNDLVQQGYKPDEILAGLEIVISTRSREEIIRIFNNVLNIRTYRDRQQNRSWDYE